MTQTYFRFQESPVFDFNWNSWSMRFESYDLALEDTLKSHVFKHVCSQMDLPVEESSIGSVSIWMNENRPLWLSQITAHTGLCVLETKEDLYEYFKRIPNSLKNRKGYLFELEGDLVGYGMEGEPIIRPTSISSIEEIVLQDSHYEICGCCHGHYLIKEGYCKDCY